MKLKKLIPLLSLAIFTTLIQPLLADQITVKNNTDDPLFIALGKTGALRIELLNKTPVTKIIPDLSKFTENDWLTYHFGLIMEKLKNEKPDEEEPTQKLFDDITLSNNKDYSEVTFFTLNKDDSSISRTFKITFEYNKLKKELNVTIDGKTDGKK